ncbi:MAG: mannose-1-phosphate guanylyltransferase/mannose-6-phosphate isomerase [Candidatus Azotimanducaceae bacterium]|uniref:mannose-1-phosphate guanylyltransferase n=1 Tax=OM182 bacterium TaxID=2510334 RepID=A0A520RWH6_9GAMM|nr:MAG: mannose-1-phosphate guanylyltransferase/mannose-6-phosphate isomerase [OM182 bacterium]
MKIVPVILCGGAGTRLWPMSRERYPKYLLSTMNGKSLLQDAILRLKSRPELADAIFVCSEETRFLVASQIEEVGITPETIILEPVSRDTAPAIALAAYARYIKGKDDEILIVLPSDHFIRDQNAFFNTLDNAISLAEKDYLVTLGVRPTKAETGYGYIKIGDPLGAGYSVEAFIEKPNQEKARVYLGSDEYCWNSGIFVFKAINYLRELTRQRQAIAVATEAAIRGSVREDIFIRLRGDDFISCPKESIDYAVMEGTKKAAMVTLSAGWGDLGSWQAMWEVAEKDRNHNSVIGDVILEDVKDSYIRAEHRLVSASGVDNIVVVETADAVLVTAQNNAQSVKKIVHKLQENGREEFRSHTKIYRPWGYYESIGKGLGHQVKHIMVNPGASLSLQKHRHRSEHWIVVVGTAAVTLGKSELVLAENESTFIPAGTIHRLANHGTTPLEVIEIQFGSYLGEDDILRFADQYGRK